MKVLLGRPVNSRFSEEQNTTSLTENIQTSPLKGVLVQKQQTSTDETISSHYFHISHHFSFNKKTHSAKKKAFVFLPFPLLILTCCNGSIISTGNAPLSLLNFPHNVASTLHRIFIVCFFFWKIPSVWYRPKPFSIIFPEYCYAWVSFIYIWFQKCTCSLPLHLCVFSICLIICKIMQTTFNLKGGSGSSHESQSSCKAPPFFFQLTVFPQDVNFPGFQCLLGSFGYVNDFLLRQEFRCVCNFEPYFIGK